MDCFVWSKIGPDAGESLDEIIARKEKKRVAGGGIFWWAIGNSLGPAIHKAARSAGGTLPILFSPILSSPKPHDVAPEKIVLWKKWEDENRNIYDVPPYVRVTSRATDRRRHYALVCHSDKPLFINGNGRRFDPSMCETLSGKKPGASQVTALLRGNINDPHPSRAYRIAFSATLVVPYVAKLVQGEIMDPPSKPDMAQLHGGRISHA